MLNHNDPSKQPMMSPLTELTVRKLPPYFQYQPFPPETTTGSKPPHWHCPGCWGEAYVEVDGQKLCQTCPRSNLPMLLCVPEICGSS